MVRSPEYNSFEHPSFERMGGNFEGVKEPLPELKEATPEQIREREKYNALANHLYQKHSITEAIIRSSFEEGFNRNLDIIWRTGEMIDFSGDKEKSPRIQPKESPKEPGVVTFHEKSQVKTEKQLKNSDTPEEKEKLTTYAELSDLAYIDFVSVPSPQYLSKTTERISKVHIDPLAFPNFKMITEGKRPDKPTEDEKIIIAYLDKHKDNNIDNNPTEQGILRARNDRKIAPDIADLLHIASGGTKGQNRENIQYASLDGKYQSTMIDINQNLPPTSKIPNIPDTPTITEGELRMANAIEHLRTIKEKQASKTFDEVKKKGFEIVDYFPNEANKDNTSSGFGAICLKDKAGNISFAIRGTELTDWGDIIADGRLAMKHVPENQTQDLITFFERNLKNLKEGQKVNITGHSLGGALTQIASIMYAERVNESYTFNSPGAKKLKIDPEGKSEIIRQKFEKFKVFEYNKGDGGSVENRMTNVSGTKGLSIISNLGEDIGDYEIKLESLESHSITEIIRYIHGLKEGSPELQRHYVGPDKEEERKPDEGTY